MATSSMGGCSFGKRKYAIAILSFCGRDVHLGNAGQRVFAGACVPKMNYGSSISHLIIIIIFIVALFVVYYYYYYSTTTNDKYHTKKTNKKKKKRRKRRKKEEKKHC